MHQPGPHRAARAADAEFLGDLPGVVVRLGVLKVVLKDVQVVIPDRTSAASTSQWVAGWSVGAGSSRLRAECAPLT